MVARGLRSQLLSCVVESVCVLWERAIDRPDVPTFCRTLLGAGLVDVARRGKFITMQFDTGQTLLTHLRMTGKLLILPPDGNPNDDPYARVHFGLGDGRWLVFSDTRKFGRMYLVDDPLEVVGKLGPEPLGNDFTCQRLMTILDGKRGRIKPLLLDQSFIAGLGNIYTDEALWRARIHPLQSANTLTPDQIAHLHAGIISVLSEAIGGGGTSLRDNQYRQPDGGAGAYQHSLAVYGRAGGDCPRCGASVARLVVGQRGTHYCPECQVLPE